MKPSRQIRKGILLLIAMAAASCIDDDFDTLQRSNWDPELAVPLVDSRIEAERIVGRKNDEARIFTDDDDVIIISYNGNILDVGADSLINLTDISFDLVPLKNLDIIDYPSPKFLLETIEFKAGLLRIHIEDDLPSDAEVTLNMPKTTKNGIPFSEQFTVQNQGGNTTFDTLFDLSDYVSDLSGDGEEHNKLSIHYTALKKGSSDTVDLNKFIVSFEGLEYSFIDGKLGNLDLGSHGDTLKLNIFENFKSGRIILEDPLISLDISNTFGLPIALNINNISGSGSGGNSSLDGNVVDNGIDVPSASTRNDSVEVDKDIDNSNSNISQFLSITPESLSFLFDLEANSGDDTTAYNFVSDKSRLKADLFLQIPMKGSLDSVIIEDIYAFNNDQISPLSEATFKVFTRNSFPLGIYVQIYFLDKNGNKLDSLTNMGTALFREASTDENGFSAEAVVEESYYMVGEERFAHIRERVTDLKIQVMLLTDDSKHKIVKIRSTDYFDLKLGVRGRRKL